MIRNMGMEFILMQMAKSMKAFGHIINNMGKEQ